MKMFQENKIIQRIFTVLLSCIILYLILGELFLPEENAHDSSGYTIPKMQWTWIKNDGSREAITVPGEYDVPRNEVMTIESVLPSGLEDNTYLRFYSLRQDMWIFVDDVLRSSYSTKDTRLFGKSSSAYYVFLELKEEDAGKKIRVEIQTDSSYSGTVRTVYMGDKIELLRALFKESGVEIVAAVITLFLGLLSIIGSVIMNWCYHRPLNLKYLGWGVVLAACWLIVNSLFRQILFPNVSVISDVTFMIVSILPIPFLIYLNQLQDGRYQKLYFGMEIVAVLDVIITVFLHVTGWKDFTETIIFVAVVCIVEILFMIGTIIRDIIQGKIQGYYLEAIGIFGAFVAAAVQFLLYFHQTEVPFSGAVVAVGLIFLLLVAVISSIQKLVALDREKQQAILANQAKARFLANMSHEIRTPINAVLGMDEMILKEGTDEKILEYAKDIRSAGKNLLYLINDILDFSKIESGNLQIIPVEYEISSLINDCYNMIVIRAREKKLQLNVQNDETLPRRMLGDEVRIRQIVINLLTNAVKYTKQGEITLSVTGERRPENQLILKIAVTDTGIGIAKENQKQLFQSFQRIEEKKNRSIEGTGLGLAITSQLLELMNGTIEVESEYGKGSTFTVTIPQTIVLDEPAGDFAQGYQKNGMEEIIHRREFRADQGRVLVVDDVMMNLKVFKGLLKDTGLMIDVAESGKKCLEMVQENQYHIIFLDHMMPEMDGVETLHEMQKINHLNQETPVIALTANAISGAREMYLKEGFADYLSKPVQEKDLKDMVLKYLPKELIKKDFMKQLTFLDVQKGLSFCGGVEELYEEVLEMYVQEEKRNLLTQLLESGDYTNYHIQVHGLKGTSISIGATEFAQQAKKIEYAMKDQNLEYVKTHHEEFMKEYGVLLEKIRNALELS